MIPYPCHCCFYVTINYCRDEFLVSDIRNYHGRGNCSYQPKLEDEADVTENLIIPNITKKIVINYVIFKTLL